MFFFKKVAKEGYDVPYTSKTFNYKECLASAKNNYPEAQYNLGLYHRAIRKDGRECYKWLKKATDNGFDNAAFQLTICYFLGEGVRRDLNIAVRMLKVLAEEGNKNAQVYLGSFYEYGLCSDDGKINYIEMDIKKAFSLYEKAAENGSIEGMNFLAECYLYGRGTSVDYKKSFIYFERASTSGDVFTLYRTGVAYEDGVGVGRDIKKAFSCYYESATKKERAIGIEGDYRADMSFGASFKTGVCYLYGRGVEQDYNKALTFFIQCSNSEDKKEQDVSFSNYNIGLFYALGLGVSVDYNRALNYFIKGGERGYCAAALCYKYGLVRKNERQESLYLNMAVQKALDYAYNISGLGKLQRGETWRAMNDFLTYEKEGQEEDYTNECGDIAYNLGYCYYNGIGEEENKERGLTYIKKAFKCFLRLALYCKNKNITNPFRLPFYFFPFPYHASVEEICLFGRDKNLNTHKMPYTDYSSLDIDRTIINIFNMLKETERLPIKSMNREEFAAFFYNLIDIKRGNKEEIKNTTFNTSRIIEVLNKIKVECGEDLFTEESEGRLKSAVRDFLAREEEEREVTNALIEAGVFSSFYQKEGVFMAIKKAEEVLKKSGLSKEEIEEFIDNIERKVF